MCKSFSHLHVHSEFSMIDGVGKTDDLVATAAKKGFSHLALTDHGSLSGSITFINLARRYGIKPIIGYEAYVIIGSDASRRFHLTLLADGQKGWEELVALNNKAVIDGLDSRRPVFDIFELQKTNSIIVLTGCPAAPLHDLEYSDAKDVYRRLANSLGSRLYAEIMPHDTDFLEHQAWQRTLQIAKELNIVPVVTNDVHYPNSDQSYTQKVVLQTTHGFDYESSGLYLATEKEMATMAANIADPELMRAVKIGMRNAYRLAEKLETPVLRAATPWLPHIEDSDSELTKRAWEGLKRRGMDCNPVAVKRLENELDIIHQKGLDTYFLICQEITNTAHDKNVAVGPGRGSGAGSLVTYALEITDVDPLRHALKFERFLNPERDAYPDIDMDFGSNGRQIVVEEMKKRYNAVNVATFRTMQHASLIRALGRYWNINPQDINELANREDDWHLTETFDRVAKTFPNFKKVYKDMIGQIVGLGTHAGGIVLQPDDDTALPLPLTRLPDGSIGAAFSEAGSHADLQEYGYVKFDVLAVAAYDMLDELYDTTQEKPAHYDLDEKPYGLSRDESPSSLLGIFQLSGDSFKDSYIKSLNIQNIDDLTAVNALWRASTITAGTTNDYAKTRLFPGQPIIKRLYDEEKRGDTFELDSKWVVYETDRVKLTDGRFVLVVDLEEDDELEYYDA